MAEAKTVPLVDSHCHIDMPDFDGDRAAVVERARAEGVGEFLLVGGMDAQEAHIRTLRVASELGMPASAGIHPHEARLATPDFYEDLRSLGRARKIVAVGEIGLDFHYDHSPRPVQVDVLRQQVRIAVEVGLPVIIHTREADLETAAILEEEGASAVGGVIHCFTGGRELADRALALGFLISFSGIMTFPKAEEIREIASRVPRDHLLVETDAPFLAPVPLRGKRNEPAFVRHVAERLATLRGESLPSLAPALVENFRRLFRLDASAPTARDPRG
jgi:TatD DNase family protein